MRIMAGPPTAGKMDRKKLSAGDTYLWDVLRRAGTTELIVLLIDHRGRRNDLNTDQAVPIQNGMHTDDSWG